MPKLLAYILITLIGITGCGIYLAHAQVEVDKADLVVRPTPRPYVSQVRPTVDVVQGMSQLAVYLNTEVLRLRDERERLILEIAVLKQTLADTRAEVTR